MSFDTPYPVNVSLDEKTPIEGEGEEGAEGEEDEVVDWDERSENGQPPVEQIVMNIAFREKLLDILRRLRDQQIGNQQQNSLRQLQMMEATPVGEEEEDEDVEQVDETAAFDQNCYSKYGHPHSYHHKKHKYYSPSASSFGSYESPSFSDILQSSNRRRSFSSGFY